jgi:hypothetical protein
LIAGAEEKQIGSIVSEGGDSFALLAMTSQIIMLRHCEERSDEAISTLEAKEINHWPIKLYKYEIE